jgi:hypothetical protein
MGRGLDGYLLLTLRSCAVFKVHRALSRKIPVAHSEGETPLPIPNRAVKPLSADGTWRATSWESRSPPVLSLGRPSGRPFFVGRLEAVLAKRGKIHQEVDGIGEPSGQRGLLRLEHRFEGTDPPGWNPKIAGALAFCAWRSRFQRRLSGFRGHQGLAGTPAQGWGIAGSFLALGRGCIATSVRRG